MDFEVVSKCGSGIDTEVERFWRDGDDLVVRYEDGSEERYLRGEVLVVADDSRCLENRDSTGSQIFTVVDPVCPLCGSTLELLDGEIVVSGQNSGHVPAHCPADSCEWRGRAVYRMVSLRGTTFPDQI